MGTTLLVGCLIRIAAQERTNIGKKGLILLSRELLGKYLTNCGICEKFPQNTSVGNLVKKQERKVRKIKVGLYFSLGEIIQTAFIN